MAARLPLAINSGSVQQLQAPTDYLDGADSLAALAGGRLTLTSGTPVTVTDAASGTNGPFYYTPYLHDRIALWNGSNWTVYQFSEMLVSLGYGAGSITDVFMAWNSGSPALSGGTNPWGSSTSRGTPTITQLDGVWVLSSDHTQRYLGTLLYSGSGIVSDGVAFRGVWNVNNRVTRGMLKTNTTSHTYGTVTWREWNGGTAEKLNFVTGLNEDALRMSVIGDQQLPAVSASVQVRIGAGLDTIVAPPTIQSGTGGTAGNSSGATRIPVGSGGIIPPATISTIGSHFISAMELGSNASSTTTTFTNYTLSASLPM